MTVRSWRAGVWLSGLLVLGSIFAGLRITRGSSPRDSAPAISDEDSRLSYMGTSSCSARACHGSLTAVANENVRRNEYTIWMTKDKKHAGAYTVLFNERSKRIAKNLGSPTGQVIDATQDPRCLACHSIPATTTMYGELAEAGFLSDGVSCESCHGPARDWLLEHTKKGYRELQPDKKRQFGMTPTRDLSDRVQLCVGCHIGAPKSDSAEVRDAYHDIMAAGHPRLGFEFGAFLANMPHHWDQEYNKNNQKAHADFEAKVWAVGQTATLHAAIDLTNARAQASLEKKTPWPEFAEYDCFACHHSLSEPSWPQIRGYAGRVPGTLPWGNWYLVMTRALLAKDSTKAALKLLQELKRLEELMNNPSTQPQEAADEATKALVLLRDWVRQPEWSEYDHDSLKKLLKTWSKDGTEQAGSSWDTAAQAYLALVALNQGHSDHETQPLLEEIFKKLKFPTEYESPRGFQPKNIEMELRKLLQQIGE